MGGRQRGEAVHLESQRKIILRRLQSGRLQFSATVLSLLGHRLLQLSLGCGDSLGSVKASGYQSEERRRSFPDQTTLAAASERLFPSISPPPLSLLRAADTNWLGCQDSNSAPLSVCAQIF